MTTLRCTSCDGARRRLGVEPIAGGYEITSYECPNCKTVVGSSTPERSPRVPIRVSGLNG
jgi:hypothetical protein